MSTSDVGEPHSHPSIPNLPATGDGIGLDGVPRSVLVHVVDVHCHPTDSDIPMTHESAPDLPIRICAMATRRSDQKLVADLARAYPDKVIPCFGYHPWFSHWISLEPTSSKEEHYRSLFLPSTSSGVSQKADLTSAFDRLLPFLPEPLPLAEVLADLHASFSTFPNAMLGEVGMDRACRVPFAHPADPPYFENAEDGSDDPRELSSFTIPLAHQLRVLEAQLALAVQLGRNVSMHSVKSQQATRELLDRMGGKYGNDWLKISVDLHSCGLSAQTWKEISKRHPNVFLSLSVAINARSPAHKDLIAACAPDRILVESDFPDIRYCAPYTWAMLRTVADVKGWRVEDSWDDDAPEDTWGAVKRLEENWKAFQRGGHRPNARRKERRNRTIEEWEGEEEN